MAKSETMELGGSIAIGDEILPPELSTDNLLVMGPALSGKGQIAFDLLADAYTDGARPCVITATDTASQFRTRFEPYVSADEQVNDVLVIDTLAGASSQSACTDRTLTVGTPADLTGIGLQLSKALGQLPADKREGSCVLIDGLSTLLMYSDLKRLFRFINSINRRINEVGCRTVHTLDTDAIDSQQRQQLLQLFSTVIEVREEAGCTEFRFRGQQTTDWYEHSYDR